MPLPHLKMDSPRKILHLDLDAFFCAVEEQRDPTLRGMPFAVGGSPEGRGVVAACSYPARKYGIHSAMPMARAVRLCPNLLIVSNRHSAYGEVSRMVMDILHDLTPVVEQISIDEAFLDVSDDPAAAREIADSLQATIHSKLSLPCSLGVAVNKLVAKIANNEGKAAVKSDGPPNAINVIEPGWEQKFLASLQVRSLWGVGPKTAADLERLGIRLIGDLAAWPEEDLIRRFGVYGGRLADSAKGLDESPVETERETKSISKETTFSKDISDRNALEATLLRLSEGVGRELRDEGMTCSTVTLKYRKADFTTLTRQTTLQDPTDLDHILYRTAKQLLVKTWQTGQAVRLLGVGTTKLSTGGRQLLLWEENGRSEEEIQRAIDLVRDRFGNRAVKWGKQTKDE